MIVLQLCIQHGAATNLKLDFILSELRNFQTIFNARLSNSACQVFWLAMVDLGGYHPGGVWQSGYIYKGGGGCVVFCHHSLNSETSVKPFIGFEVYVYCQFSANLLI